MADTVENGVHIIGVVAKDTMRLHLVSARFEPTGTIVIAGKNRQGKTSVLRTMIGALGGKRLRPKEFVRKGQKEAEAIVLLDNGLRAELHVDGENERLEVFDRDGLKQRRPQEVLTALIGKDTMAFDPVAWMRWEKEKQAELVRKLTGLDFTEINAERQRVYDERTAANRELKQKEAQLAGAEVIPDGTPDQEVSLSALAERQRKLVEEKAANARKRKEAETARATATREQERVAESEERIRGLEQQLAAVRAELETRQQTAVMADDKAAVLERDAKKLADPDTTAIAAEIANGEETNRLVRLKHQRRALAQEVNAAGERHAALEKRIHEIDEGKRKQIAAAKFPVEGMGFDAEGFVTLNGLPIDQASGAETISAAVGIGIALNPTLRSMWVKDAAILDDEQRALLDAEVRRQKAQVFLELIVPTEDTVLVLEDGMATGSAVDLALAETAGKDAGR